jgi:hypothetical protein
VRKLIASGLAWGITVAGALSLNALLSWVLWQTGGWNDRVRTNRFDPLRELRRFVEALLSLGLAGALAGRVGWPRWAAASVLLLWPLRIVAELRTAAAVSHRPDDTLTLHERGFLADTYGPLPTRAAVIAVAVALYALLFPLRAGLDWLASWAVRGAWGLLDA